MAYHNVCTIIHARQGSSNTQRESTHRSTITEATDKGKRWRLLVYAKGRRNTVMRQNTPNDFRDEPTITSILLTRKRNLRNKF